VSHNLPTRGPSRPPTHAAWVTYRPAVDPRGVYIRAITSDTRLGDVVAHAPLPGAGRPTTAAMDDRVAVLGYTRLGPWTAVPSGLVADVEPIRDAS
jgi:hypothetical protein